MAVGAPKTIIFSTQEIPKAAPTSVPLKDEFKSGEKVFCRIFFGKTFGDIVAETKAVAYALRMYADGEEYAYFASKFWNLEADQNTWVGFQDGLTSGGTKGKLEALPKGKHKIEVRAYVYVPNPNKQYKAEVDGRGIQVRDASGTTDGPVVAKGTFTFVV